MEVDITIVLSLRILYVPRVACRRPGGFTVTLIRAAIINPKWLLTAVISQLAGDLIDRGYPGTDRHTDRRTWSTNWRDQPELGSKAGGKQIELTKRKQRGMRGARTARFSARCCAMLRDAAGCCGMLRDAAMICDYAFICDSPMISSDAPWCYAWSLIVVRAPH
jgi:hypothetical protein